MGKFSLAKEIFKIVNFKRKISKLLNLIFEYSDFNRKYPKFLISIKNSKFSISIENLKGFWTLTVNFKSIRFQYTIFQNFRFQKKISKIFDLVKKLSKFSISIENF